jgi:hypothetical protein
MKIADPIVNYHHYPIVEIFYDSVDTGSMGLVKLDVGEHVARNCVASAWREMRRCP